MKKIVVTLFVLTGIVTTLLTACSGEEILIDNIPSTDEEIIEKDGQVLKLLDSPLMSYFGGSLYEGSIALDISDFYDEYYQEQGIETESTHKLIHVKLTKDLEVVDVEGNNIPIDEINLGDIIYLDFDFPNRDVVCQH